MSIRASTRWLRQQPGFQSAPLRSVARLAAWHLHVATKRPAIISLPRFDIQLGLPPHARGNARLAYVFGDAVDADLIAMIERINPRDTVLDIGSHLGLHACAFGRRVGEMGRVIAFEPAPAIFAHLRRNIALNHIPWVTAKNVALADAIGTLRLYRHLDPSRASLSSAVADHGWDEVQTDTLDAVVAREGIRHIDFIKMDVEGAEALILHAADHVLSKIRPEIALEVNPTAETRLGVRGESWRILQNYGYGLFRLPDMMPLSALPATHLDVLALPMERTSAR